MTATARELSEADLDSWDANAVDVAGGHALQSRAWAEHRAQHGWRPRYLEIAVEGTAGEPSADSAPACRALVLERSWPLIGGGSAYIPRGPVGTTEPWIGDGSGGAVGRALAAA